MGGMLPNDESDVMLAARNATRRRRRYAREAAVEQTKVCIEGVPACNDCPMGCGQAGEIDHDFDDPLTVRKMRGLGHRLKMGKST
jgi:hypothetical protein